MITTSENATQKSIALPTRSVHHTSFLWALCHELVRSTTHRFVAQNGAGLPFLEISPQPHLSQTLAGETRVVAAVEVDARLLGQRPQCLGHRLQGGEQERRVVADDEATPYLDLVELGPFFLGSDRRDPCRGPLAVPRGSRSPSIGYPPTHVHVFAADTFDLGRERVFLDSGEEIYIYSPERSVVDAMRLRGQVGSDIAYEALRHYLRRPGSSPGGLLRLARRLRAGGPMNDALEVLTGWASLGRRKIATESFHGEAALVSAV